MSGIVLCFSDGSHGQSDAWPSNNGIPSSSYPSSMLPGNSSHYSNASTYMHHPSHEPMVSLLVQVKAVVVNFIAVAVVVV